MEGLTHTIGFRNTSIGLTQTSHSHIQHNQQHGAEDGDDPPGRGDQSALFGESGHLPRRLRILAFGTQDSNHWPPISQLIGTKHLCTSKVAKQIVAVGRKPSCFAGPDDSRRPAIMFDYLCIGAYCPHHESHSPLIQSAFGSASFTRKRYCALYGCSRSI